MWELEESLGLLEGVEQFQMQLLVDLWNRMNERGEGKWTGAQLFDRNAVPEVFVLFSSGKLFVFLFVDYNWIGEKATQSGIEGYTIASVNSTR